MSPDGTRSARRLLAVCALLIVYGSLYPFEYVEPPSVAAAWRQLLLASGWWTSPGDVMGNVALFVPWGALGATALAHVPRRQQRLVGFLVGSVVFALAVQVIQIWFPSRTPSRADVLWNAVGTLVGMAAAGSLKRILGRMEHGVEPQARSGLVLIVLWVTTQWAPLIPTIDWQGIKDSLKPLLLQRDLNLVAMLLTLARVVAVGCMLEAVAGAQRRWIAPWFAVMLAVLMAGKPFIVGQSVTLSNALGYVGGYAAWLASRSLDGQRRLIAAVALLFAAYILHALTPFAWRDTPSDMHLLPFAALLEGSMELNARALLDAVFVYGALLWLAQRCSDRVTGISLALALCVLALEYTQTWLEGRTGDITEPLLVLSMGAMLKVTQPGRHIRHTGQPPALVHGSHRPRHARTRRSH
jgi:VanZ family protein